MDIDGYALVVGAASGIGLACAHMYAEEGAAGVAYADINLETAEKAAEQSIGMARNPDYRAIAIKVDVTNETEVSNMVQKTCKEFGRIDYAVNCAGTGGGGSIEFADQTLADFNRTMKLNFQGTFNCLHAEINAMKEQDPQRVSTRDPSRGVTRGVVINLGSVTSYNALPLGSAYSSSKHAVLGLTKNAALDSVKHHIRVNCLCPSFVDTPMIRQACEGTPGAWEMLEMQSPMGRLARPAEVADVAMFLSSPRSSYVSGVGWLVAGGGNV